MSNPREATPSQHDPAAAGAGGQEALLERSAAESFVARWRDVQARFVDDPAGAVKEADQLVDDLTRAISARYRDHTDRAASGDEHGDATEALRLALQRYRALFSRLLDA
jgi:hypothetical protein